MAFSLSWFASKPILFAFYAIPHPTPGKRNTVLELSLRGVRIPRMLGVEAP